MLLCEVLITPASCWSKQAMISHTHLTEGNDGILGKTDEDLRFYSTTYITDFISAQSVAEFSPKFETQIL